MLSLDPLKDLSTSPIPAKLKTFGELEETLGKHRVDRVWSIVADDGKTRRQGGVGILRVRLMLYYYFTEEVWRDVW